MKWFVFALCLVLLGCGSEMTEEEKQISQLAITDCEHTALCIADEREMLQGVGSQEECEQWMDEKLSEVPSSALVGLENAHFECSTSIGCEWLDCVDDLVESETLSQITGYQYYLRALCLAQTEFAIGCGYDVDPVAHDCDSGSNGLIDCDIEVTLDGRTETLEIPVPMSYWENCDYLDSCHINTVNAD